MGEQNSDLRPILVVDDDATVRKPIAAALRNALPVPVADFADGETALGFARETPVGLALLDVEMSPMDGREVARGLRRISPSLPIIFFTGSTEENLDGSLEGTAPIAILRKPVRLAELIALVDRHRT